MRAMVFAAGLGTRLRPLTDDRPKALVEINGYTLLEICLARLRLFGVNEAVVNVHHFADKVIEFLKVRDNFGMRIHISREDVLLDTGGGLKNAAHFFLADPGNAEESILVHNVDVISAIDLDRMLRVHTANKALATLAVQERQTSRPLLFDEKLHLCGRVVGRDATAEMVRPTRNIQDLAFNGIHVISKRLLTEFTENGVFSIITSYLRLAGHGETVLGFRTDEYKWRDVGRLEDLQHAALERRGTALD